MGMKHEHSTSEIDNHIINNNKQNISSFVFSRVKENSIKTHYTTIKYPQ